MRRTACGLAAVIFLALVASKFSPESGFTSLLRFGETWEDRRHPLLAGLPLDTVRNSAGYDGQFYAQIALDPALRDSSTSSALDLPSYRARRILTPLIAATAGGSDPWRTINAYALINVGCWFCLGWYLFKIIPNDDGAASFRWLGCMFGMGVLESVRFSLTDLPAMAFLALAVGSYGVQAGGRTSLFLALGNLAKESNLLATLALAIDRKRLPDLGVVGLLAGAIAPLLIWSVYLQLHLGSASGPTGTGNLDWPGAGLVRHLNICVQELVGGNWDSRFSFGVLATASFVLQAVVLWRRPQLDSPWWRIGAAYSVLLLFLGDWVWSGYWAVARAILPLTFAFNLLLSRRSRLFWILWIGGNITSLHALWRFL